LILITGASSGIGEATARAFAAEKRPLFLVARRQDRLASLAKALAREFGVQVNTAALDVRDRTAVKASRARKCS
jgi:short-subunit dehydrogenase